MDLDPAHLVSFHAVAESGSVTRGAERLMTSQPALSKQIAELERRAGMPLFDRLPRGVRLTAAGAVLAEYAGRVVAACGDARRAMDELRGLSRGSVTVGAGTTVGVYLLPDLFVRFRQMHPDVNMHMEIAGSEAIAARLLGGELDIGLTEGAIVGDSFLSTVWFEEEMVAIAARDHPLVRRRTVTAAMLCAEPFVVRETGSTTKSLVEQRLATRGLTIRPAMSLGSTEAIKRAVAAGVGVAIVSALAVRQEVAAKELRIIPVKDLALSRPIYRVTLRGRHQSAAVTSFIALLASGSKRRTR